MSKLRPAKKTTVPSPTPIRKSPLGKPAAAAHAAIAAGSQPGRGYRVNGKP
jgi:hypothetical protein